MRHLSILLPLLLGACAAQSLRHGMSEADVRASMGRPAMEFPAPGGGKQLVFPTGPMGLETYMASITAEGRLARVEQVLEDGRIESIRQGMASDEVLRLIGPPARRTRFDNLSQTAWDYRYRDTWGYLVILSVMVDDQQRVASRVSRRIEPDHRR